MEEWGQLMKLLFFKRSRGDDSVTVKELETLMKTEPNLEIIDLRYSRERGDNFIDGATFMPMPSLRTNVGQMAKDKFYVFCCNDGSLSKEAVKIMKYVGFTRVKWLKGGMREWRKKHRR